MSLAALQRDIHRCRACPRLVAWREEVARVKRRAYRDQPYWGRPVSGFGDPRARLVVVGLAPGAHGANRTGRIFTGDASGDFLYAALHRAGFASSPTSASRDDGLTLFDAYITCPVRCVPPGNRPLPAEVERCRPFLARELALLSPRVLLALGQLAWTRCLDHFRHTAPRPPPPFAHGAEVGLGPITLLGSYHVSRQNTQTGRLTVDMFLSVLTRARAILDRVPPSAHDR